MMIAILFALAGAAQQPRPAQQPQRPTPTSAQVQAQANKAPETPFDTTGAAISNIGIKVGELRSVYDLYRRAAYNEPDGAVLQRAGMFADACRALEAAARDAQKTMCHTCMARRIQPPIDQYHAYLPAIQRYSQSCAARVAQLKAHGNDSTQSRALRQDVIPAGTRMMATLRTYEARLHAVRLAMGWETPALPAPRRGN